MNNSSTHYDSVSYKSQSQNRRKYKIILLGDSSTGKTSIISRFIDSKFQPKQDPTIGIDFLVKNMTYEGNSIRVQLWDTAGQQKFKSLIPSYLKDAAAAIFVFDLQRPQTLKNLQQWIYMFRDNNFHPNGPKSMIGVICGNKSDIQNQKLNRQKLNQLMDNYKFPYQSVSAKTGINKNIIQFQVQNIKQIKGNNIQQLFYLTLQTIVTRQKDQQIKRKKNIIKKQNIIQQQINQAQCYTDRGPQTETRLKNKDKIIKEQQQQDKNNKQTQKINKNKDKNKNIQLKINNTKTSNTNNCSC